MNTFENSSSAFYSQNGKGQSPLILHSQPSVITESQEDQGLRDFFGVMRRRAFVVLGVSTTVVGGVMAMTLKQEVIYEGKFQVLVEPVKDDTSLSKVTSSKEENGQKSEFDYETQIQVLKSPEFMKDAIRQLQVSYPEIDRENLLEKLSINRVGETKIIEVSYKSSNQSEIKKVLDKLTSVYLDYSRENRQTSLRQGLNFVERELKGMQTRVDNLQKQLQFFRQNNNFINPEAQQEQITNQLRLLAEQKIGVEQRLAKARAEYTRLQTTEGGQAVLRDADVYKQVVTQIRQVEAEIAKERTRFRDDTDMIEVLREKRQNMLPILQEEATRVLTIRISEAVNEIQSLEQQKQKINESQLVLDRQVKELPVLARQYTELQRKLQVATDSLNRFLTTRETLKIDVAQKETPWQLVQAVTLQKEPVSPNPKRNGILGLVAGTLLGVSAALVMEKLDTTFRSVDSLKEKLRLPLLGTIPFQRKLQKKQSYSTSLAASNHPKLAGNTNQRQLPPASYDFLYQDESSKFLEALRVMYTNIQLLNCDRQIRSLVVSSALPGDGKSTLAFHLALTACAMGQKVLLVDANMRRPNIHNLASQNNHQGLSSFISGSATLEQAMGHLPAMSDLTVITAGPTPPDPTKLLSSRKMRQFMVEMNEAFDLVIYDAPPLTGLADASLLASYTDGLVLVVGMGSTERDTIQQTLDGLRMSQIPVLGMVANRVKNDLINNHYYYYQVEQTPVEEY
ncbi:polysaccharide biosynthesis tyrosine autokinase [Calothrix sp. UHCC 0171]|uniref:GumC family protein n=1 Tax=Calothrix sp. UHCC 0171 TaxID=3110245 RepID=UPI002B1F8CB0|nr:polysaccharide biosynthesis tyrosine autokinase [Calothrix sp. UHCC 0171]MEA5570388.1 polysaccharide biosynthesis tyrosine autokinase [Calothrix sp. UHCC 0171]